MSERTTLKEDLEATPSVTWPPLRRVRWAMCYGGILGVFMTACESSYVRNGLHVGKSGLQAEPLVSFALATFAGFLLAAALFGLLLPLYRFRLGGWLIGPLVAATAVIPLALVPSLLPPDPMPAWQLWLVPLTLALAMGALAQSAREHFVGSQSESSVV